jgi:tRNA (adenine22-N1)-methyltransferase
VILPRLGHRLGAVLRLVPAATPAVADVGAGHGALAVHLAASGVRRVIATEIGPGPLLELRTNLRRWDAQSHVEVREGSGLSPLAASEVEGVVVAGMGARTVLEACADASLRGVRWLVLQSMQRGELIEPTCADRGWEVLEVSEIQDRGRTYRAWLVAVSG